MFQQRGEVSPKFTDGFVRIGAGPFGAKEESLNRHRAPIRECGFKVPRTLTIGWGALESYTQQPGLAQLQRVVAGAHRGLGSPGFVAARSTAMGDNTGTGIFHSALFRYTDPQAAAAHICAVAASHDSREAECFRRELGLRPGIAAMMQAVVGQYYDLPDGKKVFGPLWSGIINTQLPQVVVLNPGLLRPETSEQKTLLEDVSSISAKTRFQSLLFCGDRQSGNHAPIEVPVPAGVLLQPRAIAALQRLPAQAEQLKRLVGADVYAEVCILPDGEAHMVQFAPLPPLKRLGAKPWVPHDAEVTQLNRGAVALKRATALVVTDYLPVHEILANVDQFSRGEQGRSLILMFEDTVLRELMSNTRELWGALRHVGAIFSVNIQEHTAPFECHLAGAMRIARDFAYGRLNQFPNIGGADDAIFCPRKPGYSVQIEIFRGCIDAEISEGHGVGYVRRSS